jgi:hypothetical protein
MRVALFCVALAVLAAGCGSDGKSSYTIPDVKAAYYTAKDAGGAAANVEQFYVDEDFHSHANYIPRGGLEVCPLMQRADAATKADNMVQPDAAEPAPDFVVGPSRDTDARTPTITQGALVFGTSTIAGTGMKAVDAAMQKCPPTYEVRGGPSPILGTYSVNSRPLKSGDWQGVAQQIAHTYPTDDVYYEDMAHVVVHRANVILYIDVTHRKVIGERSDASAKAEAVLKTVLKRLG